MIIYVGNLPFPSTEEQVRNLFGEYGQVDSVMLQEKGNTRVAQVKMGNRQQAAAAIKNLDGTKIGGNVLEVRAEQ